MGPPSCMRSVVDRNVVKRRMPVLTSAQDRFTFGTPNIYWIIFNPYPANVENTVS